MITSSAAHPSFHEKGSAWPARLAAVAGSIYFFAHSLFVILGPESRVMAWLYDDSFYYMITAKHWSEAHLSSFDGVTRTSGYHPLWMWICAIVYGIRGQLDLAYVRSCMAVALALTAAVLLITLRYAWVQRRVGLLWTIALATTSYSALNNGLSPMEWPLVVVSWFALHAILMSGARLARLSPLSYAAAFMAGLIGSFSRTDFGLIPACYLAAAVLLHLRRGSLLPIRQAAVATGGAALALPLIFFYNRQVTGEWLQQSAQIKHIFASLSTPFNPVPALWQFIRVLLYLPPLNLEFNQRQKLFRFALYLMLPIVLSAGVLAWSLRHKLRMRPRIATATPGDDAHTWALLTSLLGILGYLLLDGLNSQALYGWYTGSVTGFIVLLCAALFQRLRPVAAAAIVLPLLCLNLAAANHFGGNALTQTEEVVIGVGLRRQFPNARMAGGDVGKPSFYNHGTMFNIDGLMNNEVVPYLASGTIPCYMLHRHIEYLSDIGSITLPLTDAERRMHHLPPLPWDLYFRPIAFAANTPAAATSYRKTDFDAIRASGECGAER